MKVSKIVQFDRMLILIVLCLYSCNGRIKKQENSQESSYEYYVERKIAVLEKENLSRKIKNQSFFWGHDSLSNVDLENYLLKNRLFFVFSIHTCLPCIETTVEIIKETFPNYCENEHIAFVVPDLPVRFRKEYYGKEILSFEEAGGFNLTFEINEYPPFFLYVNKDLIIKSIHIVNNFDFHKTEKFLHEMKANIDLFDYE